MGGWEDGNGWMGRSGLRCRSRFGGKRGEANGRFPCPPTPTHSTYPFYRDGYTRPALLLSLLYLLFTVIYWAADGKDYFNNPYIYRALSWERPMSAGKLVMLILFVLCPCFNCLFWFLIWARRRVLVAAKTPSVLS